MLSSTIYCDSCGAANRVQATFCYSCGHFLHTAVARNAASSSTTGLLSHNVLLQQRYRIISQVGKGGFGAVYKAADTQFGNRLVAIKEMSQSNLSAQEYLAATEAFRQEAQLLASLTHPNLPRIYEQFHDGGRWYLVMDFIQGETLETHLHTVGTALASVQASPHHLPFEKILDLGIQLCTVLDYLHTHQPPIVFRDLKPANVMLNAHGHLYLIDFGIARYFKAGQAKDTTALGSTGYAAPEQYGRAQTTPRADIYGLGATLHQLLTGDDPADSPFKFAPLQLPSPAVPPGLDILIQQMVHMDADKRPASVSIVKQVLQRIAAQHLAIKSRPQSSAIPQGYQSIGIPLTATPPNQPGATAPTATRPKQVVPPIQPQPNTLHICSGHDSRITALAWSPKGSLLASASFDKKVRIWDSVTGKILLTYRLHAARVLTLAWSPDNLRIASAGEDGAVQIWHATKGTILSTYLEHTKGVHALAWSPDGTLIASASDDTTVRVWNAKAGTTINIYRAHTGPVLSLAWSPDGQRIASGGDDKIVQVWSPLKESRKFLTTFFNNRAPLSYAGHTGRINAVAWSPDNRRIASAGFDKSLQVWDANTGKKYFVPPQHAAAINALAWAPDSRRIASASNDKTVQVWDTLSKSPFSSYRGHTHYVTAVAWSPDGKHIASGSVDHTVQIWRAG